MSSLRQAYGLTEIPAVAFLEPADHDPEVPGRLGSCGKPLPFLADRAEISLRDESGREVAQGEIGEVCVQGRWSWPSTSATPNSPRRRWLMAGCTPATSA